MIKWCVTPLKKTSKKEKKAPFQSIYNLPDDIAQGAYSAKYFLKVSQVLRQVAPSRIVTMQLFNDFWT